MNKLMGNSEFVSELRKIDKESRMALKSFAQRRSKIGAKTLPEMLAQVFTASSLYVGTFKPEKFSLNYESLEYDPSPDGDDVPDGEYDEVLEFEIPFNSQPTAYCCGLLEIGNFVNERFTRDPEVNTAIMTVFMAAIAKQYRMVFGTIVTTQRGAEQYLTEAGFVSMADFKSKRTGTNITVLMKDFTGAEFLPGGDLDLDNLELNG